MGVRSDFGPLREPASPQQEGERSELRRREQERAALAWMRAQAQVFCPTLEPDAGALTCSRILAHALRHAAPASPQASPELRTADVELLEYLADHEQGEPLSENDRAEILDLARRLRAALLRTLPPAPAQGEEQGAPVEEAPRVWPENFWREVWHRDCPGGRPDPPMIHHREYTEIEDGSSLRLYECTRCHVKVWAGLDRGRRVVSRRYQEPASPAPTPSQEEVSRDDRR